VSTQQVIQFEYQQSLAWDSDCPRWSEKLQASVHLTDAALTSGWLREHFSGRHGGANDFLVLIAIFMHARPLRGADLDYMVGLGMATLQDEGRLYARVTDLGLSDELGMHRTTIAASAERLEQSGFIDIAEVPEEVEYRDSKGRFAGSKVYLLSGQLQKHFLSKDLQPLQSDRVGLTDMDQPSTVSVQPTYRVGPTDINLTGGGGGDSFSANAEEKIWTLFASLKGEADYRPKPRDKRLLRMLYSDGYTTQEILEGIQFAFQERVKGDPVRHFGFCIPVIRAKPRKTSPVLAPNTASDNPDPVSAADPVSANPSPVLAPDPALANPGPVPAVDTGSTTIENQPDTPQIPEHVIRIFTQANQEKPPTPTDLRRLNWLYEECASVAQQNGQEAWEWLVEALKGAAGQAYNLLPYTTALLRRRKAQAYQREAETESASSTGSNSPKRSRRPSTSPVEPTNPVSLALARRETTPSRSGFVIPAEYSQASLARALELIPDDH
jgi:hypothetical protein